MVSQVAQQGHEALRGRLAQATATFFADVELSRRGAFETRCDVRRTRSRRSLLAQSRYRGARQLERRFRERPRVSLQHLLRRRERD